MTSSPLQGLKSSISHQGLSQCLFTIVLVSFAHSLIGTCYQISQTLSCLSSTQQIGKHSLSLKSISSNSYKQINQWGILFIFIKIGKRTFVSFWTSQTSSKGHQRMLYIRLLNRIEFKSLFRNCMLNKLVHIIKMDSNNVLIGW